MLHYLVCAAIAYFLALYLNSRVPGWFTAVWSSGVAAIVGIVVGSGLVLGGMALMGIALDPGAVAGRGFAQAIIWSVAGTAAGIYHGRQKVAAGEHGDVTSIPMKAWLGWGALSIAVVFGVIAIIGMVGTGRPDKDVSGPTITQPSGNATGALDRDGKPCTEITEFLGECKRQP